MIKKINKSTPLLYCSNVIKGYQYSNFSTIVLNHINLVIQYCEMIALIGSSGSGKSTLLHIIGGLDQPTAGNVFFEGKLLNTLSDKDRSMIRNQKIGFIYQFHHLLPDFNIVENIAMPLLISGVRNHIAKNKAKSILESIGLINKLNNYPYELSGGENQRVSIARSIINNPILILADEPTGNLDKQNATKIMKLLKYLNTYYGTTFVIATHDLNLANKFCNRILTISDGILETCI